MDERRPDDESRPHDDHPTPSDRGAPDDHESAYELLQRGQDLLLQRHYAQAATVLERADRAEPGKGSILEALGRACYNSGQHERSRATFAELLELDPSSHYGHFALGQSLKRLGRTEEARIHLKLAVALAPDSALYRGALAVALAPDSALYRGALARLGPDPAKRPTWAADELPRAEPPDA